MIAYVTSIGESTTDLCVWSLERQGFEVVLLQDSNSLWDKLKRIYMQAEDMFLRVDADVIANRNIKKLELSNGIWWLQAANYGWFSQDKIFGGIQLYGKQTIPYLRQHIDEAEALDRPETYMSRLVEFHNPRRFATSDVICGLHGYKQTDVSRVKRIKTKRGQLDNYDFELAERIEQL